MSMSYNKKAFDCIQMKRDIQTRLYEETHAMNREEYRNYVRNRIASSRFASFRINPQPRITEPRMNTNEHE